LGVTHLVTVYFFAANDLAIHVYGPQGRDGELSRISGHVPWPGFGEARSVCPDTPERWPWVKVLIAQWLTGSGLGVFASVDERARSREQDRWPLDNAAAHPLPLEAREPVGERPIQKAQRYQARGAGAWLSVLGLSSSAVYVDDQLIGCLPVQHELVESGGHQV